MTVITDNGFARVDKNSIIRDPASTGALTGNDISYSDTETLNEKIDTNEAFLSAHEENTSNPHSVTKSQVGLGNVDNTNDLSKPISTATQSAIDAMQKSYTTVGTSKADYICDGTADQVQIQAAIDSMTAGTVLIKKGTYNISAKIILKAGITILGEGVGTVINNTSTQDAFYISDLVTFGANMKIEGIKITQLSTSGYGIYINGGTESLFSNIRIEGGNGIYIAYAWSSHWRDIQVQGATGNKPTHGFYLDNLYNKSILMDNCLAHTCLTGLYHNGGDGWILKNFNATFCDYGVTSWYGTGILFDTPYFEANRYYDFRQEYGDATSIITIRDGDHNNTVYAAKAYQLDYGTIQIHTPTFYAGNTYAPTIEVNSTVTEVFIQTNSSLIAGITNNASSKTTIIPIDFLDKDGTLAGNSDTQIPSQKAVKTYADTKESSSNKSTDGTFASNSDTLYPSQKASKTYADTKITNPGAWTSWTPSVIGSTSGTATVTGTLGCKYILLGKTLFLTGRISFTKNTLSGEIRISMPTGTLAGNQPIFLTLCDSAGTTSLNQLNTGIALSGNNNIAITKSMTVSSFTDADMGAGTYLIVISGSLELT